MDKNYSRNKAFIWVLIIIAVIGYGVSKIGNIQLWGVASLRDTLTIESESITTIYAVLSSYDIKVNEHDDNEIKIEIYSNREKGDIPTITQNGNSIEIKDKNRSGISFGFGFTANKVQIYVPKNSVFDYDLNTSSGNIKIDTVHALQLKAQASSGNIAIESDNINVLDANTSSGNITAKGNIIVLDAEASSGNINFDLRDSHELKANASSGNIRGTTDSNLLNIDTTSGNINIECTKMPGGGIKAKASSGNITLQLPDNDGFTLMYAASSGYTRNEFTGMKENKSGTDTYASGSVNIQVSTTSGNIKIED